MNFITSRIGKVVVTLILISITLSFHSAQAASFTDSGTFLTDNTSGLDWLDVTTSAGQSYNYVNNQFGIGGVYEGWRYATGLEFNTLLANYTNTQIASGYRIYAEGAIDSLVTLLGSTLDNHANLNYGQTWDARYGYAEGSGLDYTYGFIADTINQYHYLALILDDDRRSRYTDRVNDTWSSITGTTSYDHVGSYLVRDTKLATTPIPAAVWLMGSGLIGILGLSRKKKTQVVA